MVPAPAPLVVSIGDAAGIGPEIVAKAWAARDAWSLPPFAVIGSADRMRSQTNAPIEAIASPSQIDDVFRTSLPVIETERGTLDRSSASIALTALEKAVGFCLSGEASGMVTAPVSKAALYEAGFDAPGQTEFCARACGVSDSDAIMMLAGPSLRVVPITIHVPLADVPALLTEERVLASIRGTHHALRRDFALESPRLALAGLNPHAGEDGHIGREEIERLVPAVDAARAEGIDITGPSPADSLFHPSARDRFDAVLCCYHDQALVPIKTLHFDEAVNVTLGLPIVRTSPDHGTAFDIAGKGIANPGSMIAAIRLAGEIAANRAARS